MVQPATLQRHNVKAKVYGSLLACIRHRSIIRTEPMTGPSLTIAQRLKAARTEAGLSQPQLAELTGIAQANISNAETGKVAPNARTVDKILGAITEHMGHSPVTLDAVDGLLGIVGRTAGKLIPVDIMGEPTPIEWIANGYVARGHVTMFAGEPGAGKSSLSQTLAVALAMGHDEAAGMTLPGRQHRVMILDAENVMVVSEDDVQASLVQSRLQAYGITEEHSGNITAVGSSGFCLDKDSAALDALLSDYESDGRSQDVLILDSFTSLWTGNENTVDSVNTVLYKLNRLAVKHNVAIVLIHHTGKSGDSYRGSTAIAGAIAAVFTFTAVSEEPDDASNARVIRCVKMRIAPAPVPLFVFTSSLGISTDPYLDDESEGE
jgi:transcriptional regulator with XRE-family HTH domain/archaellum biogenesis ATPase FlaH